MSLLGLRLPAAVWSAVYRESDTVLGGGAGTHTIDLATVPDGEIWVIEGAAGFCGNQNITHVSVRVYDGASDYLVSVIAPTASNDGAQIMSPVTLFPGENIRGLFAGCGGGCNLFFYAVGQKLSIALA